jgi:hypothetical protein
MDEQQQNVEKAKLNKQQNKRNAEKLASMTPEERKEYYEEYNKHQREYRKKKSLQKQSNLENPMIDPNLENPMIDPNLENPCFNDGLS